jgi:hypothetical protein
VNPAYLERFIGDPHAIKPGTTMPDVLAGPGAAEKRSAAAALTHFLLSPRKNDFAPIAPDAVAAGHRQSGRGGWTISRWTSWAACSTTPRSGTTGG